MKRDEEGNVIGFEEFPQLETKRLVLRRMTIDDAEFYLRHFSDPEVVSMQAFAAPKNLEAAIAELKEYCLDIFTKDAGIRWGITIKGSPELVGTCGFYKWAKHAHHAEIGYDLAAAHRRQGIMSEALSTMLDYLFEAVELNRVQALVDPANLPSIRLLGRLGFSQEGVLRDYTFFKGRYLSDLLFSTLKRDWENRKH